MVPFSILDLSPIADNQTPRDALAASLKLAQRAEWLITMGCGEACPAVPGLKRDDWPLEDPKGKPVERVREIRDEVRARVLAFVEFDYGGGPNRGLAIIGLGEMYSATAAREHSECQALVAVNFNGRSELRNAPLDEWPVNKMHVYATAHVIRELTGGKVLPAAILGGGAAQQAHLRKLEDSIRDEASQPISKPITVALPDYCAKFVGSIDAPVLAGELPPDLQAPDNETFREHAFRILGQLSTDTAVTITLKLDFPANVEALAALVREYEIGGMQAELVPERSSKRVIADAQLSTYGGAPEAQIHRVRCQMRLGGEQPQASTEWYADWISVSLTPFNSPRLAPRSMSCSKSLVMRLTISGFEEDTSCCSATSDSRRYSSAIVGLPRDASRFAPLILKTSFQGPSR